MNRLFRAVAGIALGGVLVLGSAASESGAADRDALGHLLQPGDVPIDMSPDDRLRDALLGGDDDPVECTELSPVLDTQGFGQGATIAATVDDPEVWVGYHQLLLPRSEQAAPLPENWLTELLECRAARLRASGTSDHPVVTEVEPERRTVGSAQVGRFFASLPVGDLENHVYFDVALIVDTGWYSIVTTVFSPYPFSDDLADLFIRSAADRLR